jgi:hypothetical protein
MRAAGDEDLEGSHTQGRGKEGREKMTDPKDDIEDTAINCLDCGRAFLWTAEEQARYAERSHEPPKRCGECRQARRAQREGQ